ncbi:unnamed protein product [Linum tenue]|uniref:LsmAD domain-containing protein n=1 Tax=Linum tenue TaxID=586396 RepID=A0AAV0NTQ2_9ROSI|nr:unnamed protein product [Linum tenue]
MNTQQTAQLKSSANGFARRRSERESGMRLENKHQSGKLNQNRSMNAIGTSKAPVYESPSRDRLVYLSTCLIGHPVEVRLKNGSIYSGTCHTTNVEQEFAIILKMARMTKDASYRGSKQEYVMKAPSKTLIIPGKEVAEVIAKDVPVTVAGQSNELQNERHEDILIDSSISHSRHVELDRELSPWVPDEDDPQCPGLENIFDGPWNRGWDQFETNKMLFGVKSTFDEELYTTRLEKGPRMRELEREATRIAREIEGEDTEDLHLAEERGINLGEDFDGDEEVRFSSVIRGRGLDDSGYDEDEDILLDKRNTETFGDVPASSGAKTDHLHRGTSNDSAGALLTSSVDEPQCSQSSNGSEFFQSNTYDHCRQQADDLPCKSSTSDCNGRSLYGNPEILRVAQGHDSINASIETKTVAVDGKLSKSNESQSAENSQTAGFDRGGLLADAPSVTSSVKEMPPTEPEVVYVKADGESSGVSACRQPGTFASGSDHAGATSASSHPAVSPSSSLIGSSSSENSTLNPHAKEFKFNPNAKSFTPSHSSPVRPPSPVSDGSYYFTPNVTTLPQMHGMPVGIGMGPSYSGHQHVLFNPQVAPLRSPQPYFHPSGPQYGQQMNLGHPRQVLYMPGYQPVSSSQHL